MSVWFGMHAKLRAPQVKVSHMGIARPACNAALGCLRAVYRSGLYWPGMH